MKDLSFRARLLLWASAASALTLTLAIILVDLTFRANVRDQLESGLSFARQVAVATRTSQMDARISETGTLALDTRLRAAVTTGDEATISQTLYEVFAASSSGWAAVVTPGGETLAATERAADAVQDLAPGRCRRLAHAGLFFFHWAWNVPPAGGAGRSRKRVQPPASGIVR